MTCVAPGDLSGLRQGASRGFALFPQKSGDENFSCFVFRGKVSCFVVFRVSWKGTIGIGLSH